MPILSVHRHLPYGEVRPYGTRDRQARQGANRAAQAAKKKRKGQRTSSARTPLQAVHATATEADRMRRINAAHLAGPAHIVAMRDGLT